MALTWRSPHQALQPSDVSSPCGRQEENPGIGLRVRYLGFGDQAAPRRSEWMDTTFGNYQVCSQSEQLSHACSTSDFDILVLGGNDVPRLKRLLRDHLPALTNKVKLALVYQADIKTKSQLLMAGFDDVLDLARIAPPEGRARAASIWRRYMTSRARTLEVEDSRSRVLALTRNGSLSPQEFKVVAALLERKGRVVSRHHLCQEMSRDWDEASEKHLRVVISVARRKLRDGVRIMARNGHGYELLIDHDER